jgi:lipopolysaccharide export system protein LptA
MNISHNIYIIIILFTFFSPVNNFAQEKERKRIDIEQAETLEFAQNIDSTAQRLVGNVRLRHKEVLMFCDSAYLYSDRNEVDAFGNIHIIQNDTLHLYGQYLNYNGDSKFAKVRKNVKLLDKSITLTTESLDFDMNTNIGYYNNGGTIVDTTNVLTSIIGRYYSNDDLLFFKDSVVVTNDDLIVKADTLKYNSKTEIVYITGPTTIEGTSEDGMLYSEKGWHDTKTGVSGLYKSSKLEQNGQILEGDTLYYDKNTGIGEAHQNVKLSDLENHTIITGKFAVYNEFTEKAIVTDSAVFIQYSESDTLFMGADTLRSIPDTIATKEDSKLFLAYNNVRFFRTDLQGMCDSLAYHMEDSTISMYFDPVLWSDNNQMSANFIELISKEIDPDLIEMKKNSFIIAREDSLKYNQISGKDMVGYITNNDLYKVEVDGNGSSAYYTKDKDTYIGMNLNESSRIVIELEESQIKAISFKGSVTGRVIPLGKIKPMEDVLNGFNWREAERPKNKFDIFYSTEKMKGKETEIDNPSEDQLKSKE